MSAENLIIFYIGILMLLSIKQTSTTDCKITKGDCVADDRRVDQFCKGSCFTIPQHCENHKGADLFGKDQKFQCHCKNISNCGFRIHSKCEGGCLPGYKEPYCQTRKYHEFIKNESSKTNKHSYLFSSDNKKEVKPPMKIRFRNKYRFNTVEIYSNYSDATMKVTYPIGMDCKLNSNGSKTICTGDVLARDLYIDGKAEFYRITLYGCPPVLYGEDCINECHCSRGESCHQISGICKNGCEDGWYGEKCDNKTYVNIAQGKNTNQSAIASSQFFFHNGKCESKDSYTRSDKAVDGNFDPALIHGSCAQTQPQKNPFWQVTFDKPYMISQLRIYNQMADRFRLKNFKVFLGPTLCFESRYHEHTEQVIHIKCEKPENTSIVRISLEGKEKQLTLCEVEVLQCVDGFYGDMCMERCKFCEGSKCDQVVGCKQGCVKGYYWDKFFRKCEECSRGLFGQNCQKLCHCSQTCDHITGSCPGKCNEGFHGSDCQEGSFQEEKTENNLVFVIVPLVLLMVLITVMAVAIWYWKKRPVAKRDVRIPKISGNILSEGISEETAHLSGEIPLDECQSICIIMAGSSFRQNLLEYVAHKKQEEEPFNKEFQRLPKLFPMPYNEAMKPENAKKNQYKTILPYDHSRVRLQPDEISSSDYINANFICNQRYIACQGPTQSTVTDFWRMIWQLKCNTIVLLKDMNVSGKTKYMQYWPDEKNTETFGTIKVKHIETNCHSTYIHRRFFISKTGVDQDGSWTIDQYFFKKWPDHDIPQHAEYILEFRNALKNREEISYPLVVHCSAGVGRTGSYICIDILLNEMLNNEAVDVLACIKKLREDRMHLVQKRMQLEFIYDVLVENIITADYDIDVDDIPKEFSRIKQTNDSTRGSILEQQFQELIKQVKPCSMSLTSKDEEELANFNINGVFIDGPSCENQFLVTERPVEGKTVNFLRFVSENCYLNIVAFFHSNRDPPNYLPRTLNESVKIGPYLLKLVTFEDKKICIHSVLKVKFDNKKKSRIEEYLMNHFLVTIWMDRKYPSCADILKLSNILSAHQEKEVNKKFTVHSGTNFNKSGLLCITHILKDAITSQSVINIVRLVRLIKKIQPEIVPNCESYTYIWEVAEYLQKESSLYSNCVQ
ncbi:receptor-type tyrosine-protein phosphatase T-like [Octopus sinensis]|uniref:protein-tyrosine-phosphatase n=1 Tax=Octopus sinensis TaxID=2607531 RepID=A0A7E6FSX8_9MOLL|nr:receptor-type tyrosine-protein phosphatase T-like [Octopus sinensis]